MAWMQAMGNCLRCGRLFTFNPERVPSMRLPGMETKEPICEDCFHILNLIRQSKGFEKWPQPLPGAYEPVEVDI